MANHMTTRYGEKQGGFAEQLGAFQVEALETIDQTVRDVVIQVGETLINFSPVDTGRFKSNWHITFDSPDADVFVDDYDKEGENVIAQIISAMIDFRPGQVVYLLNNLSYSVPLEYGHSQKAPRGMVRITVARFQQIVEEVIRINQV